MAKTQRYYRLGQRNPRYTTKLNPFSSGMYLTNQVLPEGYAKYMVNYDIDDTGSHIKPKRGRRVKQDIDFGPNNKLGPVTLTDYLYLYNSDKTEIIDVVDTVLSYGFLIRPTDYPVNSTSTDARYANSLISVYDTNSYIYNPDTDRYELDPSVPGEIVRTEYNGFWGLVYNKEQESFDTIALTGVGSFGARTILNAYAFNKPFVRPISRPIGTILTNELITFSNSAPITYYNYVNTTERNTITGLEDQLQLTKLQLYKDTGRYFLGAQTLEPLSLNPVRAGNNGFNILHPTPYSFEDTLGGSLAGLGILPYKTQNNTDPALSMKLGETYYFRAYYQYPTASETIKYKVEILDLGNTLSTWEVLTDFTESFSAGTAFYYAYAPRYNNSVIRITLRRGDDTSTDYANSYTIHCVEDEIEAVSFNLASCKGMVTWQNCIGVYGIDRDKNTLFFSDTDTPNYFPFPNNVISFDNEILAVHNYLDNLIVITVDSVWIVSPNTTIQTSIQKRLLANLHISEIDAINLVVLKDQIFFKTNTDFYVLKPNMYTSDSTDLKNYTNSTAIANFTANFQEETVKLLNEVYKPLWQEETIIRRKQVRFTDFNVYDLHSTVKDSEVHYVYTIQPLLSDGTDTFAFGYVNLDLVYNTVARTWRIYLTPVGDDLNTYNPVVYKNKQSGTWYEFFVHRTEKEDPEELHRQRWVTITAQTYDLVDCNIPPATNKYAWTLSDYYNNYSYLDTGNIPIEDAITKRFREVQFNIVNLEKTKIKFHTDFKLDGLEQVAATNYLVQHITDSNDPDYGLIYVTPIEQNNMSVNGLTILADTATEEDYWTLDMSKFPDLHMATVRFELRGRGRRGSLQLLSTSLERYELANLTWVYRTMSAR